MTSTATPSPETLRHTIAANCRTGTWFALRPLLVQMQAPPEAGPELLADLLAAAGTRSHTEAERLLRLLSHRVWRASAGAGHGGRQAITVHSGAARWTLQLLVRPHLHIETIGR